MSLPALCRQLLAELLPPANQWRRASSQRAASHNDRLSQTLGWEGGGGVHEKLSFGQVVLSRHYLAS